MGARENLAAEKKALLSEITHTVEEMADKAFKVIQGHHGKIADNYLSLKAYAVSAEGAITKYVGHGKGKNLSSLGDLLTNVVACPTSLWKRLRVCPQLALSRPSSPVVRSRSTAPS